MSEETARPVTPLGILVANLKIALQMVEKTPGVPTELAEHLQVCFRLSAGLEPYLSECTSPESTALTTIAKQTSEVAWSQMFSDGSTSRQLEQEMLSGHIEGQALKMFVYMTRPKRILEIGMFTGYSALAMAEALPEDGQLVACEVDSYTADFAQSLFQHSPHGKKIRIELGKALDTLRQLATARESFELVFIDADKTEYLQYYELLLESGLLSLDGFICVDNTLLQGQPYLPQDERTQNGEAIAEFNRRVKDDPRVEQVLLPVRDGLTIIRRVMVG